MKQKIEGGMETKVYDILYDHSTLDEGSYGVRVSYEQDWPIKKLKSFISTEIEKAKAEAKQEVYLSMITSDLPTDYTGTATTPQEYSDNMKKFIKDEIEKHKIAIKRLKNL